MAGIAVVRLGALSRPPCALSVARRRAPFGGGRRWALGVRSEDKADEVEEKAASLEEKAAYLAMPVKELRGLAKDRGHKGFSNATKDVLATMLIEGPPPPVKKEKTPAQLTDEKQLEEQPEEKKMQEEELEDADSGGYVQIGDFDPYALEEASRGSSQQSVQGRNFNRANLKNHSRPSRSTRQAMMDQWKWKKGAFG